MKISQARHSLAIVGCQPIAISVDRVRKILQVTPKLIDLDSAIVSVEISDEVRHINSNLTDTWRSHRGKYLKNFR